MTAINLILCIKAFPKSFKTSWTKLFIRANLCSLQNELPGNLERGVYQQSLRHHLPVSGRRHVLHILLGHQDGTDYVQVVHATSRKIFNLLWWSEKIRELMSWNLKRLKKKANLISNWWEEIKSYIFISKSYPAWKCSLFNEKRALDIKIIFHQWKAPFSSSPLQHLPAMYTAF